MKISEYTVSAIYSDNGQRYCTSGAYANPTEAVIGAIQDARADNKYPGQQLDVLGVFKGGHQCRDVTMPACEDDSEIRPDNVRCRANKTRDFTVVTGYGVRIVNARNAVEAEQTFDDGMRISSVFRGVLTNLLKEVDFDRVDAETKTDPEED